MDTSPIKPVKLKLNAKNAKQFYEATKHLFSQQEKEEIEKHRTYEQHFFQEGRWAPLLFAEWWEVPIMPELYD